MFDQTFHHSNYAAGVLPVTIDDRGRRLFLVGRDLRDGTWSDFGGKVERNDRGPQDTAAREFHEETLGCVACRWGLRQRMIPQNCIPLRSLTQNGHPYWMYVMQVPYVPDLPGVFAKVVEFLRYTKPDLLEKTELAWVDLDELKALPKRRVFAATVDRHLATLARIQMERWSEVCQDSVVDAPSAFPKKSSW